MGERIHKIVFHINLLHIYNYSPLPHTSQKSTTVSVKINKISFQYYGH